jgi:hypothetical protein
MMNATVTGSKIRDRNAASRSSVSSRSTLGVVASYRTGRPVKSEGMSTSRARRTVGATS